MTGEAQAAGLARDLSLKGRQVWWGELDARGSAPRRPWSDRGRFWSCVSIGHCRKGDPPGSEGSALPWQRVATSGQARPSHSFPGWHGPLPVVPGLPCRPA